MGFIREHKNIIIKIGTGVFFLPFTIFLYRELKGHSLSQLLGVAKSLPVLESYGLMFLGILIFSFPFIYDLVLGAYFNESLGFLDAYRIAFTANGFNNLVGLGGLSGIKIRSDMLKAEGVEGDVITKHCLSLPFVGLTGLFLLAPLAIFIGDYSLAYKLASLALPAYVLIFLILPLVLTEGHFKEKLASKTQIYYLPMSVKGRLIAVSLIDWLLTAGYFSLMLMAFKTGLSFYQGLIVYLLSVLIGVISFIPGGLGSFELAAVYLVGHFGGQKDKLLAILILFRLYYYFLPWVIAFGLYFGKKLRWIWKGIKASHVIKALAILLALTGLLIISSALTPGIAERLRLLNYLIPRVLIDMSRVSSVMIGFLLIVLSKGIWKGVYSSYRIALVLLLLATGLMLIKGFDVEEAIFLAIVGGILYRNRSYFDIYNIQINRKMLWRTLALVGLTMVFAVGVYNFSHKVNFLKDSSPMGLPWMVENLAIILGFLVILGLILYLIARQGGDYMAFASPSQEDMENFEEFTDKYGMNHFTYLYYMRDKMLFINEEKDVLMMYRPYRDTILVLGDPIGQESSFENAIGQLIDMSKERGMDLAFYEVEEDYLKYYINQGFKIQKLGESAYLNIQDFNLDGKKKKNLRKIRNAFDNNGYSFEITEPPHSDSLLDELEVISDSWLGTRDEMAYSLGAFDRNYLNKTKLALVKDSDGKILSFANVPDLKNSDYYTVDLMRYDSDNQEPSLMEMLFLKLFEEAKEKGYKTFYLGMAPLAGVGDKSYSGLQSKAMNLIYRYGNRIYKFKGLKGYKDKFYPEWKSTYLAYRNDMDIISLATNIYEIIRM